MVPSYSSKCSNTLASIFLRMAQEEVGAFLEEMRYLTQIASYCDPSFPMLLKSAGYLLMIRDLLSVSRGLSRAPYLITSGTG